MNIIVKFLTFYPTMYNLIKGVRLFHDGKYEQALIKFEGCKKHPGFQTEFFFSYYGQTLCSLGRLAEGHSFLIKACKKYEEEKWMFKNDHAINLARNTLNALDHVLKHTSITEGTEYLGNELNFQIK